MIKCKQYDCCRDVPIAIVQCIFLENVARLSDFSIEPVLLSAHFIFS
jgi:hypothetical protein